MDFFHSNKKCNYHKPRCKKKINRISGFIMVSLLEQTAHKTSLFLMQDLP